MSEIYKNRHAAFNLHVHLVFITKYRKKVLGEVHHKQFSEYAAEVCRSFDAELNLFCSFCIFLIILKTKYDLSKLC